MAEHEVYVNYTTDDDGIHIGCWSCPDFDARIVGADKVEFFPLVEDVVKAARKHKLDKLIEEKKDGS